MADYYKLVGSDNPTVDWTAEVILEKDDDGNVKKAVGVNSPAQLNQDDLDVIKKLGLSVEKVSKSEAEEDQAAMHATAAASGGDVGATAPIIGSGTSENEEKSEKSTAKKS